MSVASDVGFDVDSFEWADGELVVTGRWSGVRGVRFVRPTLTGPDGARLLASLDDKPWAADEGTEWRAAFPREEPPTRGATFELAVGGGIVIEVPGATGGRFPRPQPEPPRDDLATRFDLLRSERDSALARLDTARSERHGLAAAKERAEADLRRVTRELEAVRTERDSARKERAQARRSLKSAEKRRDVALAERDATVRDLQSALLERDDANERSALLARDRDELATTIAKLRKEFAERARPEPDTPPSPAAPPRAADPAPLPTRAFSADWRRPPAGAPDRNRQRLLAALALVAVLVLAVIVLAL